jgi:hypothetical protein
LAFYNKLIAMENFTYTSSARPSVTGSGQAGVAEYQPFWSAYNTALLSYLNNTITKSDMADFLIGIFVHAHATIVRNRGDQQLLDDSAFDKLFNIQGLVGVVLAYPIDHYDDYIPPDIMLSEPAQAPNLEADTAFVAGKYELDEEDWLAIQDQYTANSAANAVRDIYEGVDPSTFGPDLRPINAYELVFDTLGWDAAFNSFNVGLDKPIRPIN